MWSNAVASDLDRTAGKASRLAGTSCAEKAGECRKPRKSMIRRWEITAFSLIITLMDWPGVS
jgi:hypothetical protein